MLNFDDYKEFKNDKEICDIIYYHNEIERLLNINDIDNLNRKMQEISSKYLIESMMYNTVNAIPPQNIYQNAENCIRFLRTLLSEKIINKTGKTSL